MGKSIVVSSTDVILKYARSRVSGNIIEVRKYEKMNSKMPITKIDELRYLVNSTGEVLEYQKTDNRSENLYGLSVSMSNLRSVLNENFSGSSSEVWATFTYRENMQDSKRLYVDWRDFWKRLKYENPETPLEYVTIAEPQKRGAWHLHCLVKRTDKKPLFLPQKALMALWGHGGVNIKRLDSSDNIGAYLSAYLSNLPTDSKTETEKSYIKGARLHLYPPGMNFYRCSRGIKKPEWQKKNAATRVGAPVYRKIIKIENDAGEHVQTIEYLQYNTKRH